MQNRHYRPSIHELALDCAIDIDVVNRDELCYLAALWYLAKRLEKTVGPEEETDPILRIPMDHFDKLIALHKYWRGVEPQTSEDLRAPLHEVVAFIRSTYWGNYNRKVNEVQLKKCYELCQFIYKTWPMRDQSHGRRELVA